MNSFSKKRSVYSITKDINKNKIILDFSLQRKKGQWNNKKKSLLILSAIQDIIIPNVFAEEESTTKNWLILDGKQRLSTLAEYLNDEFALDKSYSPEYAEKKFSELDEEIRDKISNAEITINIYQDINEEQREDIFLRLNNGQPLSASNLYRAKMGNKIRDFVDQAKQKAFMNKINFTKGQSRTSFEESILLETIMLVSGEGCNDFTKKTINTFLSDYKENIEEDTYDTILNAMDLLNDIIADVDKYKNLKPISVPMAIHAATLCLKDDEKKNNFEKNLNEFLDDYENRQNYLQYCQQGTTSSKKVGGRFDYFNSMVEDNFQK